MNYKNKENIISILIAVTLLAIGFVAVSMSINKEEVVPMQTRPVTIAEDYLPEDFRVDFMLGCMGDDYDQYDYCACTYNYLDRNYTNAEVISMGLEMERTDDLTDEMIDAVLVCESLYVY